MPTWKKLVIATGSSAQYIKGDGTLGSYSTSDSSKLPLTGGTLTGALIGTTAQFSGDISSDGGALIMGDDAYSTSASYVGMKTSFQSGSGDYMIISGTGDGSTYVSAKNGSGVNIRGGGNNSANEIVVPDSNYIQIKTSNLQTTGNIVPVTNNDGGTLGTASFVWSGVHTTSLHISSNAAPADDLTLLTLQNGNGTGDVATPNTFIDFVFKDSNTNVTPQARIGAHAGDGTDASSQPKEGKGYLTFHTSDTANSSGVEAPPERMRITNSGNVGIGNASPASALTIDVANGQNKKALHITQNDADEWTSKMDTSAYGLLVRSTATNTTPVIQIQGNGTSNNILYGLANGQVSIGSSSPHVNARLYVKNPSGHSMTYISSATNHDTNIVFEENNTAKWMIGHDSSDAGKFKISDGNGFASGTKLALSSTTATFGGEVRIQKDDGQFIIQRASSTHQVQMWMVGNNGYVGSTNATPFHIRVANSNALSINTSQNATFYSNLTVNGGLYAAGAIYADENIYHNGDTDNKIKFEANKVTLSNTDGTIVSTPTSGGISSLYVTAIHPGNTDVYRIGGMQAQIPSSAWLSANVKLLGPALTGYGTGVEYLKFDTDGTTKRATFAGTVSLGGTTTTKIYDDSNYLVLDAPNGLIIRDSGASKLILNANVFRPNNDSAMSLGLSSHRFLNIYTDNLDSSGGATFGGDVQTGKQLNVIGASGEDVELRLLTDAVAGASDYWKIQHKQSNDALNFAHFGTGAYVNHLSISSAGTSTFLNSAGTTVELATSSNGAYAIRSASPAKFSGYYFNSTSGSLYKNDGTQFLSFGSDKKATFHGHISFLSTGTSTPVNRYIMANNTNTGTGSITIQAGAGSASYGGGLKLFSHSHATDAGSIKAGISASSGGKFAVNNYGNSAGTDVFTVDASGNTVISGDISLTGTRYIKASNDLHLWADNTAMASFWTSGGNEYALLRGTAKAQDKFEQIGTLTNSFGGGATFGGTVLIDGVSNYTGLEIKGAGGARPSIKWSNVNNGTIGSIYGTEGNALIFSSGTGGATALTLTSAQSSVFSGDVYPVTNNTKTLGTASYKWSNVHTTNLNASGASVLGASLQLNNSGKLQFAGTDTYILGNAQYDYIDIIPNANTSYRYNMSGFGIGHTDPQELLHVKKSSGDVGVTIESVAGGTTPTLRIKAPASRVGVIEFHMGGALKSSIYNGTNNTLNFVTLGTNRLILGTDVAVFSTNMIVGSGSGATAYTTADNLSVHGSGDSGISILSGSTSNGSLMFGDSEDNNVGQVDYDHANNTMSFITGASTALSINSSSLATFAGDVVLNGATKGIDFSGTGKHIISGSGSGSYIEINNLGQIKPNSNNAHSTGTSAARWSNAFTQLLDVAGDATVGGDVNIEPAAGAAGLWLKSTNSHANIRMINNNGATNSIDEWKIQSNTNHDLKFYNANSEKVTFSSDGLVTGVFLETFSHNFSDDLGTSEVYIPWGTDTETSNMNYFATAYLTPFTMELVKVLVRPESILNPVHSLEIKIKSQLNNSQSVTTIATANAGTLASNSMNTTLASAFNTTPTCPAGRKIGMSFKTSGDVSGTTDWWVTSVWKVTKTI